MNLQLATSKDVYHDLCELFPGLRALDQSLVRRVVLDLQPVEMATVHVELMSPVSGEMSSRIYHLVRAYGPDPS